ncbi:MFS general substrate transporter [Xylona heveae TC161]|uniref:MFS general substrate transporter n=1 Tax=Xylona heveae (strain CBS 132557 / TC161) TaxID=1328760 RepID=A0A165GQ13_XYLHT|nr:MFS general substrate transporter [Xylona heveae TC161]KZF22454.1 MFS general substrate transporter [Xylona heveae TC161]
MSLGERAGSLASYEHGRGLSPTGSQRRKLSFNPLDSWVLPTAPQEPLTAFETSATKRLCQVIAAVVYCLFAAGIVFGFAALKPVLIERGVYRDRCTQDELDEHVRVCYGQEIRLNFMFTLAVVATNVVALPVGTVLDRFGPRICGIIGCVFLTIGALAFAFAENLSFDGYIPGYLFLALGGPFVFIPSFQLSNTFPRHSGLILSMLTGAFDASSAGFLVYRLIYRASNRVFSPKKFFLCYLVVPAFILIAQIFLMPKESYKTVSEILKEAEEEEATDAATDQVEEDEAAVRARAERRVRRESRVSEVTSLLSTKDAERQHQREERKEAISGIWGAMHGRTAWQQIWSFWFLLITLFTVIQMTRINFFVATIRSQYEYLFKSWQKAVKINEFFDIALPLGGLVSVPFVGVILDNLSTPIVLTLLVGCAILIGVLGLFGAMWTAYLNIILFVVYRPFYYTTVSDYAAKVFGFQTFGKVYGLIICLAGLFNFTESGLDALTHRVFHNNPVSVNLILLGLAAIVGSCLVGFVTYKARTIRRSQLEDEAEGASEQLMPGASDSA